MPSGSAQAEYTQKPALALRPAGRGWGVWHWVLPTSTSHSYSEASSRVTRQRALLYFLAIFWGDFWALLGVVLSDRPSASPLSFSSISRLCRSKQGESLVSGLETRTFHPNEMQ